MSLFNCIGNKRLIGQNKRSIDMKKEIRKMYLWAILKIIFALGLTALVVFVMIESGSEIGTAGVVVCSVLWGIGV